MRKFHGSPPPANDRSYDEPANDDQNSECSENLVEIEVPLPDEDLDKFFSVKNTAASTSAQDDNNVAQWVILLICLLFVLKLKKRNVGFSTTK